MSGTASGSVAVLVSWMVPLASTMDALADAVTTGAAFWLSFERDGDGLGRLLRLTWMAKATTLSNAFTGLIIVGTSPKSRDYCCHKRTPTPSSEATGELTRLHEIHQVRRESNSGHVDEIQFELERVRTREYKPCCYPDN